MSKVRRHCFMATLAAMMFAAGISTYARLAHPAGARAETACNSALLRGAYAYAGHGTIPSAGRVIPNSHVGRINFDGSGKLTGTESNTNNAETRIFSYAGTYVVNPDCTCTATASVSGVTWNYDFVAMNQGSDVLYVIRDGNSALSGTMTRMFRQ